MSVRLWSKEWMLMVHSTRPEVSRQPKAFVGRRLWVWFWRQYMSLHTDYDLRREVQNGKALAQAV